MTKQEKDQQYSNLCAQIGDHFLKIKYHENQFAELCIKAKEITELPTEEEKDAQKS